MAKRRGSFTNPPKQITVVISAILLFIGLLGTVFQVRGINIPGNYATLALILSSLLMILGSLFRGV